MKPAISTRPPSGISRRWLVLIAFITLWAQACSTPPPDTSGLRISELVASNDGVWLDEEGEADDFIELVNTGAAPVQLAGYAIADERKRFRRLPDLIIQPGQAVVFWADENSAQGSRHLPFKLGSDGDTVHLRSIEGAAVDRVAFTQLPTNASYARVDDTLEGTNPAAFAICRYPTPERRNGTCGPPAPPELPEEVVFQKYNWPHPWPAVSAPLAISEMALRPAGFIEVVNTSAAPLSLDGFVVRLAATAPGQPWPDRAAGAEIDIPATSVAPGERLVLPVTAADTLPLESDPAFEGVVTVFDAAGTVVDRVDFMRWPMGAVLARPAKLEGPFRYCTVASAGIENDACDPLQRRDVGDRLRHLRTPGDFAELAAGSTALTEQSVKFVVDMANGDVVHMLSTAEWPLHYNWVRERITGEPRLDLCDATQNMTFRAGWTQFSVEEYFVVETRRYLLGTLVKHAGAGLHSVEFALGDMISSAQMAKAFFLMAAHVPDPTAWFLRPQAPDQTAKAVALNGMIPAIDQNGPYRHVTYQPLSASVGYGKLVFAPAAELATSRLVPQTILITDDVPNDIALVGGLITETLQTPLAHVNVLSKGRGTPNMGLRAARVDPRLQPLIGSNVRLEVRADGFDVRAATAQEVEDFWKDRLATGKTVTPRLDSAETRLLPLRDLSLVDLPRVGAKAAQLAELGRVLGSSQCAGPVGVPENGFAIPVAHSIAHSQASGAAALVEDLLANTVLRGDVDARNLRLEEIRRVIESHPVSPTLMSQLRAEIQSRFGANRVRLRSSSNTEDLPEFNGAGLYLSVSAELGNQELDLEKGLRTVWASLWRPRAFAERELAGIDHRNVAMGVLVHKASLSERANGVAVSRNLLNPNDGDIYYVNVQQGEASVTNPAPGIATEQMQYRLWRMPKINYLSRSSFSPDAPVLRTQETELLACRLLSIHDHFRRLIDPLGKNPWFAVEIEFKVARAGPSGRELVIKQARPYKFGPADIPKDCRETL